MRKLLKSKGGFTLVELMVVVVVLGILAGIAVQRMGDVRDRAETAAREANTRLLLGAANLAKVRNYGDFMLTFWQNDTTPFPRNGVIRWQRPCEGPPVVQFLGQRDYPQQYVSGYNHFAVKADAVGSYWEATTGMRYDWNTSQEWNLEDYLEAFPVGYAVEIVFPPTQNPTAPYVYGDNDNLHPRNKGYHVDRDEGDDPEYGSGGPTLDPENPYNHEQIYIYKYRGDALDFPENFDPLRPGGTNGNAYPYHGGTAAAAELDNSLWVEVFPVDRW